MNTWELLVAMIMMHFLCDYPLQGDFIGKFKNRHAHLIDHFFVKNINDPVYSHLCDNIIKPGNPPIRCNKTEKEHYHQIGVPWWHLMTAHAFIQGGGVYVLTGSVLLGLLETVFHFGIDVLKCENITNIDTDQALHIWCKIVWTILAVLYVSN